MKHFRHLLQILLFAITLAFIIPAVVPSSGSLPGSAIEAQAASVKISAKSAVLIKGQTKTLKISGTKEKVKWSSSKKSVAAVSSKGKVTAKKKGTATITAKVGGRKYACKVTVETPKISKKTVTLIKGKTKTLKISGTTQKVKWSSSKKSVATVNSKGKVTAKKKGTATITAKVGGKKYTCKVKVETPKISKTKAALKVGGTLQLKMSGTSQTVKWSTNKKSVATVSSKGKVTAKKKGTATITAKTGGKNYSCKVTVKEDSNSKQEDTENSSTEKEDTGDSTSTKENEDSTVAVTGISLDQTNATITEGDSITLTAAVNPTNASNKTVTWSSSNTEVASVSSNGTVTALSAGTTTITATSGDKKATCLITVSSYISQFSSEEVMAAYSLALLEGNMTNPNLMSVTSIYYGIGDMFSNSEEHEVVMIRYNGSIALDGYDSGIAMFWKVSGISPVKPSLKTEDGEYIQLSDAGTYLPCDLTDAKSLDVERILDLMEYIANKGLCTLYYI